MSKNGPNQTVARFKNPKSIMSYEEIFNDENEAIKFQKKLKNENPGCTVRKSRYKLGPKKNPMFKYVIRMYEKL